MENLLTLKINPDRKILKLINKFLMPEQNKCCNNFESNDSSMVVHLEMPKKYDKNYLRKLYNKLQQSIMLLGSSQVNLTGNSANILDDVEQDQSQYQINLEKLTSIIAESERQDEAGFGYKFNGWTLNEQIRQLNKPDGTLVTLSAGQYKLLITFFYKGQNVYCHVSSFYHIPKAMIVIALIVVLTCLLVVFAKN